MIILLIKTRFTALNIVWKTWSKFRAVVLIYSIKSGSKELCSSANKVLDGTIILRSKLFVRY